MKIEEAALYDVIVYASKLRLQEPPCRMQLPCSSFRVAQCVAARLQGEDRPIMNIDLCYNFTSERLNVSIEAGVGMVTYSQF